MHMQLLQYISSGQHVLELLNLGNCINRLKKDMRKLLSGCTATFGTITFSTRGSTGDSAKDALAGLNLFAWCIRLIPYLMPDDWGAGGKVAEVIPQYVHILSLFWNV